jgi:hypothetical protein
MWLTGVHVDKVAAGLVAVHLTSEICGTGGLAPRSRCSPSGPPACTLPIPFISFYLGPVDLRCLDRGWCSTAAVVQRGCLTTPSHGIERWEQSPAASGGPLACSAVLVPELGIVAWRRGGGLVRVCQMAEVLAWHYCHSLGSV